MKKTFFKNFDRKLVFSYLDKFTQILPRVGIVWRSEIFDIYKVNTLGPSGEGPR